MWHAICSCFQQPQCLTPANHLQEFQPRRPLSDGPPLSKSEDTFMRTLIILSIVVLLKIEQELTRRLVQRAVPRRRRTDALRQ
jgi:hypothetical protein